MLNKSFFLKNLKHLNLNFGPQHPAAHGVLRMTLVLSNEKVFLCDPHIGLLHRGTEHLITTKNPTLSLPYFDRLDYVSMMCQEHAYCLSLEKFNRNKKTPFIVQKTRVVFDEITRVLNHLLAIACHTLDVGSMSSIFWSFEERENLMELYEMASGSRMHAAFYRPNESSKNLSFLFFKKILNNISSVSVTLTEINSMLLLNKVWKIRLKNIGVLTVSSLTTFGCSGVLKRSCGVKEDLRILKKTKYSFYNYLNVVSFISKNGDSFDRFVIRLSEIFESLNIINSVVCCFYKNLKTRKSSFFSIENTVTSFKGWSDQPLSKGDFYSFIESPKGFFGVFLKFNGNKIEKCKIKSPSYNNLFLLKSLLTGYKLADLVTLIGTIDIVFGEIDR